MDKEQMKEKATTLQAMWEERVFNLSNLVFIYALLSMLIENSFLFTVTVCICVGNSVLLGFALFFSRQTKKLVNEIDSLD